MFCESCKALGFFLKAINSWRGNPQQRRVTPLSRQRERLIRGVKEAIALIYGPAGGVFYGDCYSVSSLPLGFSFDDGSAASNAGESRVKGRGILGGTADQATKSKI